MRRFGVALLLLCLLAPLSRAEEAVQADSTRTPQLRPRGTGFVAPPRVVRARRPERQEILDGGAGFATVLESASWSGGLSTAARALGAAVGVNVRDSGGLGGYSTLSIRGSTASQVPVFLDGVPLASPDRGEVNLADVNLQTLERIEVYRGAAPLLLGGGSLGGAVHLYSAAGVAPPWARLSTGSHGRASLELGGSARRGGFSWQARARYLRSRGDWEFDDDNGTLYNPDDDERVARVNNDLEGGGALLSGLRRVGAWRLQVAEMVDLREQGAPGYSVLQSRSARARHLTHQLRIGLEARPSRVGRLRGVELFHRLDQQGFTDPDGDLGGGASDRTDRVHSLGLSATGGLREDGAKAWRVETRWARLTSRDERLTEPEGRPQTRLTAAASLQPTFRLRRGRLLLSPGVRVELHHDRFHGTPPFGTLPTGTRSAVTHGAPLAQVGVRWRLSDELDLKANLAASTRMPTLLELFGARGTVLGNPQLDPEKGVSRDLGLVWSRPSEGRRAALGLFLNDAWDLIAFAPVNPATTRAFNVGRAEIRGLELDLQFGRFGPFELAGNVTRMEAVDRTDDRVAGGKQLPGRPGMETSLRWGVHTGSLHWEYGLVAVGENYAESGERTPVPSRVLHHLSLLVPLGPAALDLAVRNLGNEEVFDLWGHPLPGRTLTMSLGLGGHGVR